MKLERGTAPHRRGVFEEEHDFQGRTTFRVHICTGRLIAEYHTESQLGRPFVKAMLVGILDELCEPGHDGFGATCRADASLAPYGVMEHERV